MSTFDDEREHGNQEAYRQELRRPGMTDHPERAQGAQGASPETGSGLTHVQERETKGRGAMVPEFKEWAPISRLYREIVITEKIDGTNGVVNVGEDGEIHAGSRSRWLTAATGDNHGFAKWVGEHADELRELGPGYHYGEWWGSGVNKRHYGLEKGEKRWSLFNTHRWSEKRPACCEVVPILYAGPMGTEFVEEALASLRDYGSRVTPGFRNPEGIVIHHTASKALFKVTLENDGVPKSLANAVSLTSAARKPA